MQFFWGEIYTIVYNSKQTMQKILLKFHNATQETLMLLHRTTKRKRKKTEVAPPVSVRTGPRVCRYGRQVIGQEEEIGWWGRFRLSGPHAGRIASPAVRSYSRATSDGHDPIQVGPAPLPPSFFLLCV